MLKRISILIIICFAAFGAAAQTEKYTAPVKWERYAVSDKSVSILFPKLPVLVESSDACAEMETRKFATYAEGIAYGLNITSQTEKKAPDSCRRLNDRRKFDEKRFEDRLNELKVLLKTEFAEKVTVNNSEILKISNEIFSYWLINDFKNKRWFELVTTNKDETKLKVKNFLESFKIEKSPSGIEIGKGESRAFGDENLSEAEVGETSNIKLFLMAKPGYTEVARQANIQGTVRLRVIFLANGGIGSVTPVSSLPYGLTENAIAAAQKIVFIPGKKDKVFVTTARTVEYSFSIY